MRSQPELCILCYSVTPERIVLDHIAAGALYLLWKRRRNNDGSLVAAKELHQELVRGDAGAKYHTSLGIPAVKRALRELRVAGMVEYGESKKNDAAPGPAPNGYRLSADPPIITWRATAALVMLLRNHSERRLRREVLIEESFKLGVTHHNRDEQLTREELAELIAWCIRKEYIAEVEVTIDDIGTPVTEKRLVTTFKVDDYELFLQKLAAEVKRQVATARSSSGEDEDGLQETG